MHLTHHKTLLSEIENSDKTMEILIEGDNCTVTKVINSKYHSTTIPVGDLTLKEFNKKIEAIADIDDDLWVLAASYNPITDGED